MASNRVDPRIIGVAFWLIVLAPAVALACSPSVIGPPVAELYDSATDIFIGKVVGRQPGGNARFSVVTRFKGEPATEMVDSNPSTCMKWFEEARTYLVFGVTRDGRFSTGQTWYPMEIPPAGDEASQRRLQRAMQFIEARAVNPGLAYLTVDMRFDGTLLPASVAMQTERVSDGTKGTIPWSSLSVGYESPMLPGTYRLWPSVDGARVGPVVTIVVAERESKRVTLGGDAPAMEALPGGKFRTLDSQP